MQGVIAVRAGLAEAVGIAREQWRTLAVFLGLGVVLPFLLLSSEPFFNLRTILAIAADPWTYRVGGSIAGPLYLIAIVVVIVAGMMMAAWNALLPDDRPDAMRDGLMSEVMTGMVGGFGFLAVHLLIKVALALLFAALAYFTIGAARFNLLSPWIAIPVRTLLWLCTAWLSARFLLAGPIMGAAGKVEPVTPFIASWRMTKASQWWLLGLFVAMTLVITVLTGGLTALHIALILSNPAEANNAAEWVMSGLWLLLWMLIFAAYVLIPAGLWRAARTRPDAAAIFG